MNRRVKKINPRPGSVTVGLRLVGLVGMTLFRVGPVQAQVCPAWQVQEPPAISADGRFVAFASRFTNLVPGEMAAGEDVFVHDRQTGLTERVRVSCDGRE